MPSSRGLSLRESVSPDRMSRETPGRKERVGAEALISEVRVRDPA